MDYSTKALWAWVVFGVFGAWAANAAVEGSSTFALIAGPLIMYAWMGCVLLLDAWVRMGNVGFEWEEGGT
jgi:hypothetical protein